MKMVKLVLKEIPCKKCPSRQYHSDSICSMKQVIDGTAENKETIEGLHIDILWSPPV